MMRFLVLCALLLPTMALAEAPPPYTIDMTTQLHDADGRPLYDPATISKEDPDCGKCAPLTLGRVLAGALFAPEQGIAPAEAWSRGVLAQRMAGDKAAVLTADEVAKLKPLVMKAYPSPLIAVQVYPLLDPNDRPQLPAPKPARPAK